jgi:TIR domain
LIYSHKDRRFLEKSRFTDYLQIAANELKFELWWDKRMIRGSWEDEIRYRLEHADVVVCFISPPFLISPFITEVEAKIVSRRQRSEGLIVIPVIYQDCPLPPWIKALDPLPDDSGPTYLHGRHDQIAVFKAVADTILERVKGAGATFREPRSLYTLRLLRDDAFSREEMQRLLMDSRKRADHFVVSRELQQQICDEARVLGASPQSPLSKTQLEQLDVKFLARREVRRKDAKKIRWVLRAHQLHPQGRVRGSRPDAS